MLDDVIEAHDHGEDGHRDEQGIAEGAQPGAVGQPIQWPIDGPAGQPALIQLEQPLIALRSDIN